jgi:hypothetical protein
MTGTNECIESRVYREIQDRTSTLTTLYVFVLQPIWHEKLQEAILHEPRFISRNRTVYGQVGSRLHTMYTYLSTFSRIITENSLLFGREYQLTNPGQSKQTVSQPGQL